MSRLCYSKNAFMRRIRMSEASLFVIVEGRVLDPLFFDSLCAASPRVSQAGYQIWLAEQANAGAGGKSACLSLFDYYSKQSALEFRSSVGGQRVSVVFALDRDLDDLAGEMRVSPHIIYTKHADVEAEIFSYGSDRQALSIAASLDDRSLNALISTLTNWRDELARNQREWIELCYLAIALKTTCVGIGYGKFSTVNVPNPFGPIDHERVRAARARILAGCAHTVHDLAECENSVLERIDSLFIRGDGWCLVKGKWVPKYLFQRLKSYFGGGPVDLRAFEDSLAKFYFSTLDFRAAWSDPYRSRLETLI